MRMSDLEPQALQLGALSLTAPSTEEASRSPDTTADAVSQSLGGTAGHLHDGGMSLPSTDIAHTDMSLPPPGKRQKRYVVDWSALGIARGRGLMQELDDSIARKDLPDAPFPSLENTRQISKDVDWTPCNKLQQAPVTEGLNERFCNQCRRVLEGTGTAANPTFHDPSEGAFLEHHNQRRMIGAAAKGCPMCSIVWSAHEISLMCRHKKLKEGEEPGHLVPMRYDFGRFLFVDGLHAVRFHPYLFYPPSDRNDHKLEVIGFDRVNVSLHVIDDDVKDFRGAKLDQTVSPADSRSLSSDETMSQINEWLDDCRKNHPECSRKKSENYKTPPFIPSRLLDLDVKDNDDGGGGPPKLRLVERDNVPQDAEYLTLSHCWGNRSTEGYAMLTTCNYADFLAGVNLLEIPRNFQHACITTLLLGRRYLWIDSLCIIQDSPADWFEQSKLMWETYSHSTLNISATAATNSDEGIFNKRGPSVLDPGVATIPDGHPQIRPPGRYVIYNQDEWLDQVDSAPVNTRAWVLQERLLSRRVVHFSRDQVFWECRRKRASERFPEAIPEAYDVQGERALLQKALDSSSSSGSGGGGGEDIQDDHQLVFLEAWEAVVLKYTACGLTRASDKLIALSALARQMADQKGELAGEYLAGLWSRDLYKQLCWRASVKDYIRTDRCDAPSWSWASVDGLVRPKFDWSGYGPYGNLYKSRSMIQVLEATVKTADGDPFVSAQGGRLRLIGPLFRIDTSFAKLIAEVEEKLEKARDLVKPIQTREESSSGIVKSMRHQNPDYTGENLKHSTIQDAHGAAPPYKMAVDASAGLMVINDSSGPQRWVPEALTQVTAHHKFSFGDNFAEAEMIMDKALSILDIKGSEMYFLPVVTKSGNSRRLMREGRELHALEGLVLVPDGDDPGGAFKRRGVATMDEYSVGEFICELGNQEDDEEVIMNGRLAKRASARLGIDDYMPERWTGKGLDFIPKDLALYDITIT